MDSGGLQGKTCGPFLILKKGGGNYGECTRAYYNGRLSGSI